MSNSPRLTGDDSCPSLKVILVGATHCGKSCLVVRYVDNDFNAYQHPPATIGTAFSQRVVRTAAKALVTLNIWDTGGQERYKSVTRNYFRGAQAAILCFEVGNQASFDKAREWYDELRQVEETTRVYLCGTKLDLVRDGLAKREIQEAVQQHFAHSIGAQCWETSSKTGEGVGELFAAIAEDFTITHGMRDEDALKSKTNNAGTPVKKVKKVNCSCG